MRVTPECVTDATSLSVSTVLDSWNEARASQLAPTLTVSEIHTLLSARDSDLQDLLECAAQLRDEGLRRAGRAGIITYSKKVFLPITNMCRDRCHYCTFVESPRQMLRQSKPLYMSPEQILSVATQGAAMGCKEALFTLGDRPEDRWSEAREWLDANGYESTLHYVRDMAEMVRERTGLLPHLNPGVMTATELEWLRPVAPSMGMMLETTSVELWSEPGRAHYGSPDKEPRVRIATLKAAGKLKIPFTTGILLGIGESLLDRAESLLVLRELQDTYGHLQEIIVQNFRAKPRTAMQAEQDLETQEYLAAIATTRLVMGPDMRVQVPPNLSDQEEFNLLVQAGVDDWGGVSPLTADHVNPERPWPSILALKEQTAHSGFELHERLTAHPYYLENSATWIDERLTAAIEPLRDDRTHLANETVTPKQQSILDLSTVLATPVGNAQAASLAPNPTEISSALARATRHPASATPADLELLLFAEGDSLDAVTELANQARRYSVGEVVTVIANSTIDVNAFSETQIFAHALEEMRHLVRALKNRGVAEICVQGQAPQGWGDTSYLEIARAITAEYPGVHLHAFRPADMVDGSLRAKVELGEYLSDIKAVGVSTAPGTGVKLLDEQHRTLVAPSDLNVDTWVSTIRATHAAGLPTTAAMVYGLGESALQRIQHLKTLIGIQRETGGFTELVMMRDPSRWVPLVPGRSERDEHRAMIAVARLAAGSDIRHIQVAWPRVGLDTSIELLRCGADDLGGTLVNVGHGTGGGAPRELTSDDVRKVERVLARPVRFRTTQYGIPSTHHDFVC